MSRGRKPQPTLAAAANTTKTCTHLNIEDPSLEETRDPKRVITDLPEPPNHFNERQRLDYVRFAGYLQDWKCLTWKTLASVLILAQMWSEWEQLVIFLNKEGHTYTNQQGTVMRYPQSVMWEKISFKLVTLLSELGFTPAGASRIKPSRIAPHSNEAPKGTADPQKIFDLFKRTA